MRNRFARFMYGRYGVDALNNFLFGLYVALFVLELFFRRTVAGQVMVILGYPIILLYFFRCFSRNIYKRSAENQRFLKLWNPVKNYGHYIKMKSLNGEVQRNSAAVRSATRSSVCPKERERLPLPVRSAVLNL